MPDASHLSAVALAASPIADRYHADGILGAGAHGVVLAARDAMAARAVALKVANEAGRDALANEARALEHLGRAASPVAPLLHDVHEHPILGAVVVMERVRGATLADRPAVARATASARVVARRLLSAVARLHDGGVVHGDLKPEHVILAGARIRLVDFGLARRARGHVHAVDEPAREFAAGAGAGSPAYLAPERFLGWPADEASDLYAVGAILYELLTGRGLVDEDDDLATARHVHLHEEPRWPGRGRDAALVAVIARCLEKDPWRRPADAHDALAALDRPQRRRAGSR